MSQLLPIVVFKTLCIIVCGFARSHDKPLLCCSVPDIARGLWLYFSLFNPPLVGIVLLHLVGTLSINI